MSDARVRANTRSGRVLFRVALVAAALVAGLAICEVGARFLLAFGPAPYDSEKTRAAIENVLSAMNAQVPTWESAARDDGGGRLRAREVLHPYVGFDAIGQVQDDAVRSTLFELQDSTSNYNILVLGGSVAALFGTEGMTRVRELLALDPRFAGRTIRSWQGARGGFKEPQQVGVFNYLTALGQHFDAVILLDGFNEVAITNQNATEGCFPLYPFGSKWIAAAGDPGTDVDALDGMLDLREMQQHLTRIATASLDLGVWRSAALGTIAIRWLDTLRAGTSRKFGELRNHLGASPATSIERGPSFTPGRSGALNSGVRAWMEGSLCIWAMCRERGIFFLHVLQPTLHDKGSKPLTQGERERGAALDSWIEAVRIGYPRLRRAGESLTERGVAFYDATQVFAGVNDELYYDACHFNDHGARILANAIAKAFLDALPKDGAVSTPRDKH